MAIDSPATVIQLIMRPGHLLERMPCNPGVWVSKPARAFCALTQKDGGHVVTGAHASE